MAITLFMISASECLFSYALMAALCRSIAKRNSSEDLSGINRVKYSYALGLFIIFSLKFSIVCLQVEMPVIDKMWEYASGIALIPSCLLSISEVRKNPENKADRSMRAILGGIIILCIGAALLTRQIVNSESAELQKMMVKIFGKDSPDFKAASEKMFGKEINLDDSDLPKEIQDNFSDLLKEVS